MGLSLPIESTVDQAAELAAAHRWVRLRRLSALLSWRIYSRASTAISDVSAVQFENISLDLLAHAQTFGDTAIITFRGTVGLKLISDNWTKINLRKALVGTPARHQGFNQAWMALRPQIVAWLEHARPKTVILTGHSLGAALAQLAGYDLADRFLIERIFLFAPPMVGGAAFNDSYAQTQVQATGKDLLSITDKYLLLTDAIALPVSGFEPGEPISRIDRLGQPVKFLPGFVEQVESSITTNGIDPRLNKIPGFDAIQRHVDWGPPTLIDQMLPGFRGFAAAGGLWGWVGYIAIAATSPVLRSLGFHSMAGYAKAFGNSEQMMSVKLPDSI